MADSGDEEVARELATLDERPAEERAAFLIELGWSREGRPMPGIEPWLEDGDPLVRVAAAHACWQTGALAGEPGRLVAVLVEGLLSDDEDLSLTAGTALLNMGRDAVEPLTRIFGKRGEKDALIVRVLGEIGGEATEGLLRRAARSGSEDVAAEARVALEAADRESPSREERR